MIKDIIKQKQQWKPHPNAFLVENELKKSSITSDSELLTTLTPYFLTSDGSLCTINGAKNHADIVDHFREKLSIEPESNEFYIDGLGLFIDKTGLIRVRAHPNEILEIQIGAPPTHAQLKKIEYFESQGLTINYEIRFLSERKILSEKCHGYQNLILELQKCEKEIGARF